MKRLNPDQAIANFKTIDEVDPDFYRTYVPFLSGNLYNVVAEVTPDDPEQEAKRIKLCVPPQEVAKFGSAICDHSRQEPRYEVKFLEVVPRPQDNELISMYLNILAPNDHDETEMWIQITKTWSKARYHNAFLVMQSQPPTKRFHFTFPGLKATPQRILAWQNKVRRRLQDCRVTVAPDPFRMKHFINRYGQYDQYNIKICTYNLQTCQVEVGQPADRVHEAVSVGACLSVGVLKNRPGENNVDCSWWEELQEDLQNQLTAPYDTLCDPSIYSFKHWDNRVLTSELGLRMIRNHYRAQGWDFPNQCLDEDEYEDLLAGVVEFINQFVAKIQGNKPIIVTRKRPSTYTFIDNHQRVVHMPEKTELDIAPLQLQWARQFLPDFKSKIKVLAADKLDDDGEPLWKPKFKTVFWMQEWIQHSDSRTYDASLNVSVSVPRTHFNEFIGTGAYMWEAIRFVRRDPGFALMAVDKFLRFLRDVICCDPDEAFGPLRENEISYNEWIFNVWMHCLHNEVLNPSNKFMWAMYVWSVEHGVGKGFFSSVIQRLVGPHNVYLGQNLDSAFGKFDYSSDKTCVLIDEVDASSYPLQELKRMKQAEKDRITASGTTQEKKYRDPQQRNSQTTYIMFSNYPPNLEEGQRRVVPGKANPRYRNKTAYWEEMNRVMLEQEGWKAVYVMLATLKPSETFTTNHEPCISRTTSKMTLISSSLAARVMSVWLESGPDIIVRTVTEAELAMRNESNHAPLMHHNHIYWCIRAQEGERWNNCFSIADVAKRFLPTRRVDHVKLLDSFREFFEVDGEPHPDFKVFANANLVHAGVMESGVYVSDGSQLRRDTLTWLQIPSRDEVHRIFNSKISGSRCPDNSPPHLDAYKELFTSLQFDMDLGFNQ